MEMTVEARFAVAEASEGRLRDDGLAQRRGELTEQAPGAGTGQAAAAQRGESSNSSMSGSSRRAAKRCARM